MKSTVAHSPPTAPPPSCSFSKAHVLINSTSSDAVKLWSGRMIQGPGSKDGHMP